MDAPSPTPHPLANRRIAITGANRGLGRAIAEAAVSAGATVVVHARTPDAASATQTALSAHAAIAGDLRDPTLAPRLAALGPFDAIVLSAGILGEKSPLGAVDLAHFADVLDVNVTAQARLFSACLPGLLDRKGRVIWLSSGLGRFALPRYGAYCVSKHAVEALAALAHADYAAAGLSSFSVAPGMVQTAMLAQALETTDISDHTLPAVAARGFLTLLALPDVDARALSGTRLDIDRAGALVPAEAAR